MCCTLLEFGLISLANAREISPNSSSVQHLDFALFFKNFVAMKILIHTFLPSTRTNAPLSVISVGSVVENGSDIVSQRERGT
jgi:hypothetical protein